MRRWNGTALSAGRTAGISAASGRTMSSTNEPRAAMDRWVGTWDLGYGVRSLDLWLWGLVLVSLLSLAPLPAAFFIQRSIWGSPVGVASDSDPAPPNVSAAAASIFQTRDLSRGMCDRRTAWKRWHGRLRRQILLYRNKIRKTVKIGVSLTAAAYYPPPVRMNSQHQREIFIYKISFIFFVIQYREKLDFSNGTRRQLIFH